jgi:hypothetical protein
VSGPFSRSATPPTRTFSLARNSWPKACRPPPACRCNATKAPAGQLLVSASLEGPQAAFALRPRGGKPQITDGPYAEAKEMVGGFFIIEAADRDEAVRVASLHPAATLGVGWGIEVHPIGFSSRPQQNRSLRQPL